MGNQTLVQAATNYFEQYRPKLSELYNFSAATINGDTDAIVAIVQSKDKWNTVPDIVKEGIESMIGKDHEYEGKTYPVIVTYRPNPSYHRVAELLSFKGA